MTENNTNPDGAGAKPPLHSYSREAGLYVSKGSVWFVAGLVALLFFMAWFNYNTMQSVGTTSADLEQCSEACQRYLLEGAQLRMQTAKVLGTSFHRFGLSSMAFIASLVTIVLGSVLIFDRITGAVPNTAKVTYKEYFFDFASPFPGAVMVFLGSVTLGLNLYFSGPGAASIYDEVHPLYVSDINRGAHVELGLANAFGINNESVDIWDRRISNMLQLSPILPSIPSDDLAQRLANTVLEGPKEDRQ